MPDNGHDPADRRDLRDYKLVTFEELRTYAHRYRNVKEHAEQLSARLAFERSLLHMALHELAVVREAKDPKHFIDVWLREHPNREEWW